MMRKTLLAVALSITALSAHADYQCSVTPRDDVILSPQQVQVKGENGDLVIKPDGNLTFNGKAYALSAAQREQAQDYQASLRSSLPWIDEGARSRVEKSRKALDKIITEQVGANSSMHGRLTKLDAQLKEQMNRIIERRSDGLTFHYKAIDQVRADGQQLVNQAMGGILQDSINEMGAKAGLVAPDETTFNYVRGRLHAPKGKDFDDAVAYWKTLKTDDGATFDTVVTLQAAEIAPQVTWGTNPGQVISVTDNIPDPASFSDPVERASAEKALAYMGLKSGIPLTEVAIDKVFIGSCTNSRIEDLRAAAEIAKGRKVAPGVQALVVPGSGPVKAQAEAEGLDKIFIEAGFEWRLPGCSMCLAMNNDRLNPGERCASTSNRNFEGRQGRGGRTHLVSPAMAAAAAVTGHFADIRNLK
ncbi:DUF2884 family protein [Klebsiella pneumoniae]|nr:DUF2884 family protein [Klebsiella pneumoniae]